VLVALVDRQDHELARAGEAAVHQEPREVAFDAGTLAFVPGQDLFDLGRELHRGAPMFAAGCRCVRPYPRRAPSSQARHRDRASSSGDRQSMGTVGVASASWRYQAPSCAAISASR
jgi:hypothetical protein